MNGSFTTVNGRIDYHMWVDTFKILAITFFAEDVVNDTADYVTIDLVFFLRCSLDVILIKISRCLCISIFFDYMKNKIGYHVKFSCRRRNPKIKLTVIHSCLETVYLHQPC